MSQRATVAQCEISLIRESSGETGFDWPWSFPSGMDWTCHEHPSARPCYFSTVIRFIKYENHWSQIHLLPSFSQCKGGQWYVLNHTISIYPFFTIKYLPTSWVLCLPSLLLFYVYLPWASALTSEIQGICSSFLKNSWRFRSYYGRWQGRSYSTLTSGNAHGGRGEYITMKGKKEEGESL